ncbi:MAG: aldehyde ferredoxin oxidoreductase family protein [bacterium]|nr:aldehyde ferredoxin oxidoreductase family protein [bacterium]
MSGTYTGKLLRVNLTTSEIKKEEIPENLMKDFIGGRGLGTKYFSDEVPADVDPLSIDNKLIFAAGPLTGTIAPTGARYMVVTKAPLTQTIASSNSGGDFGAQLKHAGYDVIIFEGKAKSPVYLSIIDDKVEINDASHLWGKDVYETTDLLVESSGDKHTKVACIGPAGEKLVKLAAIMNDKYRAAGRNGVGAVMGTKNLKAIITRGHNKLKAQNHDLFKKLVKAKIEAIKKDGITGEGLPALGTKVLDNIINENGLYPTRNFQEGVFASTNEVCGEALVEKGYLVKNKACYACPISCGRVVKLPNGEEGEGPEYETGWAYGADCDVDDLNAITQANNLCNRLGLDTISAGATLAAAMELYEKGFIKKEEFGKAPELKFGSSEAIVYYTRLMAYREGFGDKLAEGSYRLADSYGHPELSMTVKKQEIPAYDPRGVQGHALQYATSNRGGCHVRGYLISPEILGVPEKLDPQALEGKAAWVKAFQDLTAVIDACGLCLFTSFVLGADDYRELLNAATGFDYTTDELMKTGDRIWTLEKQFNMKAGFTIKDDTLPPRFLKEPMPEGPQKGAVVKLDQLLPQYYELRGWDSKGVPTQETLTALGLK